MELKSRSVGMESIRRNDANNSRRLEPNRDGLAESRKGKESKIH